MRGFFRRIRSGRAKAIFVLLAIVVVCIYTIAFTVPENAVLWHGIVGKALLAIGVHYDQQTADWIKDYQGILGGVFAIIAALLTVLAMVDIDSRAEIRHQQLVSLTLRSDALRVERLIVPHFQTYVRSARELWELKRPIFQDLSSQNQAELRNAWEFQAKVDALRRQLDGEKWVDAKDLMGGELSATYDEVKRGLNDVAILAQGALSNLASADPKAIVPRSEGYKTKAIERAEADWAKAMLIFEGFAAKSAVLEDQLLRLQTLYKQVKF